MDSTSNSVRVSMLFSYSKEDLTPKCILLYRFGIFSNGVRCEQLWQYHYIFAGDNNIT